MGKSEGRKRKLGRWWLDLLLVVAVIAAVRACQAPDVDTARLPEFSTITLDGRRIPLRSASGRPTILHFWASWCGVCEAEAPNIAALAEEARVITVASRSGSDARVKAYLDEQGLRMPVVNDPSGQLAARFGVRAFPTTFVLNGDGEVVVVEVGYTTLLGLRARLWWAGW